ncbi:hypothetical protein [Cryobacterium zongtaii]|uniref:hypothetical protein n=1 Tax=Cryobacterium zongtaii TaxID=1259217 RepID=UPI0010574A62|nr:hypothetical protein [Cryobacterium zongtaii]
MSRRRAAPPPPIEEVARIAERLAVLLSAGVSPVSAWDYLLPPGPPTARWTRREKTRADAERAQHSILAAAGRAARNGDDVADAIADAAAGLPDQLGDAWRASPPRGTSPPGPVRPCPDACATWPPRSGSSANCTAT